MLTLERDRQLLYLSRTDIEALQVSANEVGGAVEAAFREKAAGRVEVPPKPRIHTSGDAFITPAPMIARHRTPSEASIAECEGIRVLTAW